MRTIAEPSFRKLFAEINAIEKVAIDQKTKFRAKATLGGLNKNSSEKPKTNVISIGAIIATTGIKASLVDCILLSLLNQATKSYLSL